MSNSLRTAAAAFIAAGLVSGCGSTPPRPKVEDRARLLAPIPACVAAIPGFRSALVGMNRSLRDEYWKIVYPSFDDAHHRLQPDSLSCTGHAIQAEPEFKGLAPVQQADDRAITLGGGADGVRAVWLRSHRAEDGSEAGALALVRATGDTATVLAVGAYKGKPGARLSLERLDSDLMLLVTDDGCTGKPGKDKCDATLSVYLARQGRLLPAARVATERVDFDVDSEPPLRGRFRYHLTATPVFAHGMLRVVEHVSVGDQVGREVRWAEQERVYRLDVDRLEPSEEPLWTRMFRPTVALKGK